MKIVQRVPVKIVIDSGLDPDASAAARPLASSRICATGPMQPSPAHSDAHERLARCAWRPRGSPWLIAGVVTLAPFMEILDTTIVNVSLPHIAGSAVGEL